MPSVSGDSLRTTEDWVFLRPSPLATSPLAAGKAHEAPDEGDLEVPLRRGLVRVPADLLRFRRCVRHCPPLAFPRLLATSSGFRTLLQSRHGRVGDTDRIGAPDGFRQDVADPGQLHDDPDGAAGDDSRPLRGGPEDDDTGAVDALDGVGQRRFGQEHPDHVLLGRLDALADRLGDFPGLALADTHAPALIAHGDEGREAQVLAALDDLRDPADGDDLVLELKAVLVEDDDLIHSSILHSLASFAACSPRTRCPLSAWLPPGS